MPNLLANPNNWRDLAGNSPPLFWNGTSYVIEGMEGMVLLVSPQPGDTIAFSATSIGEADSSLNAYQNVNLEDDPFPGAGNYYGINIVEGTHTPASFPIPTDQPDYTLQLFGGSAESPGVLVLEAFSALQANDDEATTVFDTPVNIAILANDLINNQPATLEGLTGLPTIVEPPTAGSVAVQSDGSVTYTPPSGFCGILDFVYEIETQECPALQIFCTNFSESEISGELYGFEYGVTPLLTLRDPEETEYVFNFNAGSGLYETPEGLIVDPTQEWEYWVNGDPGQWACVNVTSYCA